MRKEDLIKKWLDNNLTADELKEFEQLEEYGSYMKLSEKAQFFKAPDFNSEEAYKKLRPIIDEKRATKSKANNNLIKLVSQMAAAFIIGFGLVYFLSPNGLTTVETMASEKTEISLPDESTVQLNSKSSIEYNSKKWKKNRELTLEGEAYFKVAKGSQFNVKTSSGVVSVLGTQFNVKNRTNYFEVQCFEGRVSVKYNDSETVLTAGKSIRIVNNTVSEPSTDLSFPTWIANNSSFDSVPLSEVLAEFERQYDVIFDTDINTDVLYTGSFIHNNEKLALQSITIPFDLEYTIIGDKITLIKIEK